LEKFPEISVSFKENFSPAGGYPQILGINPWKKKFEPPKTLVLVLGYPREGP